MKYFDKSKNNGAKMRILWFTNIQMPDYLRAKGVASPVVGGWMQSLLNAIREYCPNISIGVAFAGDVYEQIETRGVKYYCIGRMSWQRNNYSPAKSFLLNVSRCVTDFKPDFIHVHGSEGIARAFERKIATDVPMIASLQGVISGYYPHYCGGLTADELRPFASIINKLLKRDSMSVSKMWREHLATAEQKFLNSVDGVMGRTDWDRAWARALAPHTEYFHVGEVLRPEFYAGLRNENLIRRHTIYCSAALSYPLKGGHWLLKALRILKKKFPDVQLRVAGADYITSGKSFCQRIQQSDYSRYIQCLINELKIGDNVVLLPKIDAHRVREELERADVFCLPSLVENSPNSLGEAIMTGTPCVVTDVGGNRNFIDPEKSGVLVPSADPAMLAYGIEMLFEDRERTKAMIQRAYAINKIKYEPSHVVNELKNVYDRYL